MFSSEIIYYCDMYRYNYTRISIILLIMLFITFEYGFCKRKHDFIRVKYNQIDNFDLEELIDYYYSKDDDKRDLLNDLLNYKGKRFVLIFLQCILSFSLHLFC